MKTCFKCERSLPLDEFYVHQAMGDGYLGKCKECTRRDVREHYARTRAARHAYDRRRSVLPARRAQVYAYLKRRDPVRVIAMRLTSNAIRDGRLIRMPCEVCGTTENVEAHHDDYSKPLDVRWLCFRHHRELVHGHVTEASLSEAG